MPAAVIDLGMQVAALIVVVSLTTVLSAAGYAAQATARARPGARFLSHGARLALLGRVPLAILLLGLILLHGILLPFVVGMAAAYLLDPAADWLQRLHFGRTAATISITAQLRSCSWWSWSCWCCRRWPRRRPSSPTSCRATSSSCARRVTPRLSELATDPGHGRELVGAGADRALLGPGDRASSAPRSRRSCSPGWPCSTCSR